MKKHSTQYIGMDLGNKKSSICILSGKGEVLKREEIGMTKVHVEAYFKKEKKSVVVMEVGTSSPWVSRIVKALGHQIVVANARNIALIVKGSRKSDKVDAEQLARLARADMELLHPVEHRSEAYQNDLLLIKARGGLVEGRKRLVLQVQGLLKSLGHQLPKCSSARFSQQILPTEVKEAMAPLMSAIDALSVQIAACDRKIEEVSKRYPQTRRLREISGVGPVTALTFILTIGNIARFKKNRDIGAYLGMVPKRRQSGGCDPRLGISKQGDVYLRQLIVQSAHYIMGPFGPDCDLRRFGEAQLQKDSFRKKRVIVAVARKLAVLMVAILKSDTSYEPLRTANARAQRNAA